MKTYDLLEVLGAAFDVPLPSWCGEPLVWRRASGAGPAALEVASVCGLGVALREAGRADVPPLLVPEVEWQAFLRALRAGEFGGLADPGGDDGREEEPYDDEDDVRGWGDDDDDCPVFEDDEDDESDRR
ncbi:hypothetical protein ACG83_08225 [Frankia sp. R43]|uniref:DUF397 domain-containing protein n=1 Tax=Frankia sp. R43 TaxID=269536 RepID=UPI0006CA0881|nr:DUF397 domain-containing protein [Frankia sp. R43]KPM55364.1 hypothetical protein ACG83_08225 [Frankia sp. R43]